MGPSAFTDGGKSAVPVCMGAPSASMGPSAFTDGGARVPALRKVAGFALMGPSAFTGGGPGADRRPQPFAQLQWGRRLSPTEARRPLVKGCAHLARFNGAVGFHRRRPRPHPVATRTLTGFNGAVGFHRRRRART